MNKLELYSDLSFNFDTDFESMLMESMIDEAECEAHETHMALESYLAKKNDESIDDALESLMSVIEGEDEDCCDDDEKEAYLRSVCEAADSSLGQKIVAAWKHFVARIRLLINRISNSIKNIITNFSMKITAQKIDKIQNIRIDKNYKRYLESLPKIINLFDKMNYDEVKKISNLLSDESFTEEKDIYEREKIKVSKEQLKQYISDITAALKVASLALKRVDNQINMEKIYDSEARENISIIRNGISTGLNRIRLCASFIAITVDSIFKWNSFENKYVNKGKRMDEKIEKKASQLNKKYEKLDEKIKDDEKFEKKANQLNKKYEKMRKKFDDDAFIDDAKFNEKRDELSNRFAEKYDKINKLWH